MKLRHYLELAATGWIAGVGITLLIGFVVFPAFERGPRMLANPEPLMLAFVLLAASLAAAAGGILGGRVVLEGGRATELFMAALLGVLLAMPVSCMLFWSIGW